MTRRANLPPSDFSLVAVAPWINGDCTLSFLRSARRDLARGFLFYQPDNSTSRPPPSHSSVWDLNDGGQWKANTPFPVYVVPGSIGEHITYELSLYSGNMTAVPFGHNISELPNIDPRDYVRVYTQLSLSISSSLPSIWVFLVAIGAFLVVVLVMAYALLRFIQQKRRNALRYRVETGQVDLEALGIKRLRVPVEVIESLPVYTYYSEDKPTDRESPELSKQEPDTSPVVENPASIRNLSFDPAEYQISRSISLSQSASQTPDDEEKAASYTYLKSRSMPFSQPTCPICLDEFQTEVTPIRELPCGHIFHPDCIDSFLSNNSSLCPMCKRSVLPVGYCPTRITNAMVRRERNIRRLRSRITVADAEFEADDDTLSGRVWNWGSRFARRVLNRPEPAVVVSTPATVEIRRQGRTNRRRTAVSAGGQEVILVGENGGASVQRREEASTHEPPSQDSLPTCKFDRA